jgi:hypothetical protein
MPRNHRELDLAFWEIKERVGRIALGKNRLVLAVGGNRPSFADLGEEAVGIEGRLFRFQKGGLPCAQYKRRRGGGCYWLLALGLLDLLQCVGFDIQVSPRTPELVKRVGENDHSREK